MAKIPKNNATRLLAKAIATSSIASYLLDSDGKLLFANHALAKLLSVPEDQLQELQCSTPLAPDTLLPEGSRLAEGPNLPNPIPIASLLSCPPMNGSQRFSRAPFPFLSSRQNLHWDRLAYRLESSSRSSTLCFILPRSMESGSEGIPGLSSPTDGEAIHQKLIAIRHRYAHLDGLISLVGTSSMAKRALHQVQAAIAGNSPVCILGPEGSGKIEVARAIFAGRNKRQGVVESSAQLFPVDCRLMDAGLLANLFEVVDASNPKGTAGKRPTILLDRIDLLPLEAHLVLQTFLEGNKANGILSTTTKPLFECHDSQSTWKQIVSRIDIQTVDIAPLSRRPEDIPLVIQALLHRLHQEKTITKIPGFDAASMNLLLAYGWPNNVRELREAVREACSSQPNRIEAGQLPIAIRTYASFIASEETAVDAIDLDAMLLSIEKSIILGIVERYPSNRALAARQLGISRTRLLRRLEQLGLSEGTSEPTESNPPSKKMDRRKTKAKSIEAIEKSGVQEEVIEFTEIDFKETEGKT